MKTTIATLFDRIEPDLISIVKILAKAFIPVPLIHFTDLPQAEQAEILKASPYLLTNHTDWTPPFDRVPRIVTTFRFANGNTPPPAFAGTPGWDGSKPLPTPGDWFAAPGYAAWTHESGQLHLRFGARWNDNDRIVDFPDAAFKRMDEQEGSVGLGLDYAHLAAEVAAMILGNPKVTLIAEMLRLVNLIEESHGKGPVDPSLIKQQREAQ